MVRDVAYRFRVRHDEVDSFAHLNNAVCVKYMQEAAIQASTDAGYSLQWYEERAVAWVVRRLEIRYYLQVRYGDELEVRTWISECRRSTCTREYDVTRTIDGARVARGRGLWVYIDSKSGRPIRLPQEIKNASAKKRTSEFAVTSHARWKIATVIVTGVRCKATSSIPLEGRTTRFFLIGSNRLTTMRYAWPAIRSISCVPATGWFSREVTRSNILVLLAT